MQDAPVLRLNLRRTSAEKKVSWNSDTVDNENMGKKKSKCEYSNLFIENQFEDRKHFENGN